MNNYKFYQLEGSIKAWKDLLKENDEKIKKYSVHEHNADLLKMEKENRKFIIERLERDQRRKKQMAVERFKQASKELHEKK